MTWAPAAARPEVRSVITDWELPCNVVLERLAEFPLPEGWRTQLAECALMRYYVGTGARGEAREPVLRYYLGALDRALCLSEGELPDCVPGISNYGGRLHADRNSIRCEIGGL